MFIPGIGEQTERQLWHQGITTWEDLQQHPRAVSHDRVSSSAIQKYLSEAAVALEENNAEFFTEKLPQNKYWRLFRPFQDQILYLDIETTGLSWYYDRITTVATYDGGSVRLFVKDHNLDKLRDVIEENEILVTFNGKRFDQVFLQERFPDLSIPTAHLDLVYLAKSVGMDGPLKQLEKEFDIHRPPEVQDFSGKEAPVLWRQFLRGDDKAFKRLAIYNIFDTVNLAELLHEIYRRKVDSLQSDISTATFQTTFDEVGEDISRSIQDEIFDGRQLEVNAPTVRAEFTPEGIKILANDEPLIIVNQKQVDQPTQDIEAMVAKIRKSNRIPVSVGIDISGSEDSLTGMCVLDGSSAELDTATTDTEIINYVLDADPEIVSIDSPLTLPEGRCCVEESCECSEHGIMRECERMLKQRGVNVYPCLIDSMRNVTARGRRISQTLEEHGYETIESYPGAAQDVLNIPRKQISLKELEQGLRDTGIKIQGVDRKITNDELDALTSALVGHFYLADQYEHIGRSEDSGIVIPRLEDQDTSKPIKNKL